MTLLTVKQAASRAGVSDSLVYDWCAHKRLPHYRFGGKGRRGGIRIDAAELDAFLARCRQEAEPEGSPLPQLKHINLG